MLCIHAFPNGVRRTQVQASMAGWQLHLHLHPHPRLARTRSRCCTRSWLLLHSNVFEALSSMLAGFGLGVGLPISRNPIPTDGEGATSPWCRKQ